ncbi:hypothetical protein M885DRAFT_507380 [Pelagophyceae sp. CCMP2097]|nr:hypothetical protein M885DRAFT_507380 [Pelagophyceae sp. CCMP2097]|mmetsp:Transcript_30297/g.104625  ORF Transcript_30297/g.104625 Transcript_30297/m.104625 type:complete len:436 (+) Transcript_30297:154-1461(+)
MASPWYVAGGSAAAYSCLSLAMVFLNKEVLDAWQFPSTLLILTIQLLLSFFLFCAAHSWYSRRRRVGTKRHRAPRAASAKLAVLFVLDVIFGQAATRSLGLDALAAFRRFAIPIAFHLEVRTQQASFSWPVFGASWCMVLGPMLAVCLGRGKAFAKAETGDWWDALSGKGCFFALCSACTVAARVVYLKSVLELHEAEKRRRLVDLKKRPSAVSLAFEDAERGHDGVRESRKARPPCSPPRETDAGKPDAADGETPPDAVLFDRGLLGFEDVEVDDDGAFAAALLSWNSVLSLPLTLLLVLLDADGLSAAFQFRAWRAGNFVGFFIALMLVAPLHEVAVYLCTRHNSALTTLVAGGFKSTAISTYRALLASALEAQEPADLFDVVGMIISGTASTVYMSVWWAQHRNDTAYSIELPRTLRLDESEEPLCRQSDDS